MSVVGDFTIPAEAFALEQALSTVPEMTIEADHLTSHSPREVFPFLWAAGSDHERIQAALADDPSVTEVSIADETEGEALYRMVWEESFCELIHDMVDHHAAILDASAQADQWKLRLRFSTEEMLSSFQDHFHEQGHQFEVLQLHHPTEPRQRAFGLTTEQHEALLVAVNKGYFSVPRTASTQDVSETLGISANAASERIRRGTEQLIRSGILIPSFSGETSHNQ